jgi:hypothetical protein
MDVAFTVMLLLTSTSGLLLLVLREIPLRRADELFLGAGPQANPRSVTRRETVVGRNSGD